MTATQPPIDTPKPLTLGDLIATCWRHRTVSLGTFVLVAATVVLATFRMTPMFEANASLAVDRGRKAVEFQVDPDSGRIEYSQLNTEREKMLATPVLEQALKDSGLDRTPAYADSDQPLEVFKKRIKVTTKRDSWVISVSLRDEQPDRAQVGLDKLVNAYLQKGSQLTSDRSSEALVFLSNQTADARKRVEQARGEEQEFCERNAIVGTDPNSNQVAQRLDLANKERADLDQQMAQTQALLQQIDAANGAPEPAARLQALLRIEDINRHPVVVAQQQLLYDLEDRAVLLGQKYLDRHPRMIEIHEQIAAKKGHLAEAVALAQATIRSHHQELGIQAADLKGRIAAVEAELNAYRTNLASLQALSEETKSREDIFQRLLTRLNEEQVASQLASRQVTVIDPPLAGNLPVNIKKPLFLAAALFLGLVAGVLMALLAETLDRRVRGAANTQELTGMALLGQLPFVPGLLPLGKGGDPEQPSVLAESYRALRTALRLIRREESGCRILVITSSGPGEGKSTVSTRLSISLASAGSRVLLIDADLRKPSLHRQLGDTTERGLSFLLAGEKDVAPLPTDYPHLDFLPVGVRPPNPSELLTSPNLKDLLDRARTTYDYVIVDTPPISLISDSLIVGELADGLMLVVRDRVTPKATLRLALNRLAPLGHKMLGMVFNAEQHEGAGYGYYYRYKYHYKYGYGYGYGHHGDGQKPGAEAEKVAGAEKA